MIEILCGTASSTNNLEIWIPTVASIITLVLTGCFYIFIQPYLTYKGESKASLREIALQLSEYMTEVVSYSSFDGVPTQMKKYSVRIKMHFKNGRGSKELNKLLEDAWGKVEERKTLGDPEKIKKWNEDYRKLEHDIRILISKYCGVF